jgi:CRISPR-associated protein Cas5h
MSKLISVDFYADFGFLKKPDTNDPMYFSFNMLHKPALLGILGAIIGEKGFSDDTKFSKSQGKGRDATSAYERGEKPDYYAKLGHLKIGIQPLRSQNGIYTKDVVHYNNGNGYASEELGSNLIVKEQFIIKPGFRCFFWLEKMDATESKIYEYLQKGWAEYLPYLGKNDFSMWWTDFQEYEIEQFQTMDSSFEIKTLFIKETPVKEGQGKTRRFNVSGALEMDKFMYFENLPITYDTVLWQYQYESFAYTNFLLKPSYAVDDLFKIKPLDKNESAIIQLF